MNHEHLCSALKHIAWGYILIHLNINLGTIDILPDFAGYLLLLGALPILGQIEPSALLLRPFGIGLVLWHFVSWVAAILGITTFGYLPTLLASIVNIYFHFQLLTNLAAIARTYNCPQEKSILGLRTIRTIMVTLFALPFPWNEQEMLTILMILATLIVVFAICVTLFSLHKSFCELAPEDQEHTELI